MKQKYAYTLKINIIAFSFTLFSACSEHIKADQELAIEPHIFPDYKGITIPINMAPLHFSITDSCDNAIAQFSQGNLFFEIKAKNKQFKIAMSQWQQLMQSDTINVRILTQQHNKWTGWSPFYITISADSIDPYLAYRLIEPGYEFWKEMGLYQRCLENFEEEAFAQNKMTKYNCMNCHSFCQQNSDKMLFHFRKNFGGTFIINGKQIEKLNTKTLQTATLVYPSWHPSGRFIAFSVNNTQQIFHSTNPNRAEVFDHSSDVVVYDVEKHEVLTSPLLFSTASFETFPTFSPDGQTLYFCTADSTKMPDNYQQIKYSLCSIVFNPTTRQFGSTIDTLYNGKQQNKSVSLPRVSPDGRFLLFTLAEYGTFSIWHKDADLYMIDLKNKNLHAMDLLNSNDVESYHSWSSNGRWIVFSSRRIDGLYTRPFFSHIDKQGNVSKPFLLPQNDIEYYSYLLKSYNIPEFITNKINLSAYEISQIAINEPETNITFINP